MAPLAPPDMFRLVETVKQSPPIDTKAPYDANGVAGKTILITGGASGLGAGFARKWASHGAHLMIGDVNDKLGQELVAELRSSTGSQHHHFIHCNVVDWQSQVDFFRTAAELSPTRGIDAVVPSAAVADLDAPSTGRGFENPRNLDTNPSPPPPNLTATNVNLIGVMYSVHLALFWLEKNGTRESAAGQVPRDRHLLLIASIAGITGLPGNTQYSASKHAVVGLFRALRGTSWRQNIRVNMLLPYFVETPIVPPAALLALAGGGKGQVEDVVDAGTRMMADEGIVGRSLCISPRFKLVKGKDGVDEVELVKDGEGNYEAVWEAYAQDYNSVEVFVWRMIRLINTITVIRGWLGFWSDVLDVLFFRKKKKAKTT